jgi:hypothetical protein
MRPWPRIGSSKLRPPRAHPTGTVSDSDSPLKERRLWSPVESLQVRIFPISAGDAGILLRLSLRSASIFLALFLLLGFLTVALGDGCFAWSSDDTLLRDGVVSLLFLVAAVRTLFGRPPSPAKTGRLLGFRTGPRALSKAPAC